MSSQWRKVQDRLEDDERCSRLEKLDRLLIFQACFSFVFDLLFVYSNLKFYAEFDWYRTIFVTWKRRKTNRRRYKRSNCTIHFRMVGPVNIKYIDRTLTFKFNHLKERVRRIERKNRDEFRKLMEEHISVGVLTAKTFWRDYCLKVEGFLICCITLKFGLD